MEIEHPRRYGWEDLGCTSEAPHIGESDSASPPLPRSKRATVPLSTGGGGNA